MNYEIQISRIHKGSPYNVSTVIPRLKSTKTIESIIDLPEVDELINKTYGKHLIVHIHGENPSSHYMQYEVTKSKAII
ncbi:hypothetical protein ACTS95_08030 [Empedobacter brevis]